MSDNRLKKVAEKTDVTEPLQGDVVAKKHEPSDFDSLALKKQDDLPDIPTSDGFYRRFGWIILLVVFGGMGVWSAIAPLSSAAVAPGEVAVETNNLTISHYEGGIVDEIDVKEGAHVEKGQVLLRLSPTQASSELASVQARLNEALGMEARLKAERSMADKIVFPKALLAQKDNPDVAELMLGQRELFKANTESLNQELAIYRKKVKALEQQISGLENVLVSLDSRIASYRKEVVDWEALFKEQFTDKVRLEQMKRDLSQLEGEKASNESEIARLRVQIQETQAELVLRKQRFLQEAVAELRRVQTEKLDLMSRKITLLDRLNRIEITAPTNGSVKGLEVHTVGGVVRAGEPLMEIVPDSKSYVVEVRVSTSDIDRVHVGLLADVRFSAFNTQMTHVIEGEVVHLSPDSFEDKQNGTKYFEAKILITEKGVEQMKKDGLFMLPGMPAEAIIQTGARTFFGYLVKPIADMLVRAFNED